MAIADSAGYGYAELLALLSIPLLIALNGFFVAAEFALVAVRKTRIEEMIAQGVPGARAVETALAHLDRTIAATQLGITLASILLGLVGEPVLAGLVEPWLGFVSPGYRGLTAHGLATLGLALIVFLHVIFGELLPKSIALHTPDRTALWLATPLNGFARLTRPVTLLLSAAGNRVIRWLGYQPASSEETAHSLEELALLIQDTEEAGLLDADQADMVENVFRLANKRVRDCMIPRAQMAALELTTPPEKVLEAVRAGAHTRMPVYEGELDSIVGVVNTKNLFFLFSLHGMVVLADAMYPATFLDPAESIANALRLFRKSRKPMALVRDEAGTIHGLLTLEDVLEEIVGDLEDEHDRPTPTVKMSPLRAKSTRDTSQNPVEATGPGGAGGEVARNGPTKPNRSDGV